MTIIAMHTSTPQGRTAVDRAVRECLLRGENLIVTNGDGAQDELDLSTVRHELGSGATQLEAADLGIDAGVSQLHDPADAVLQIAQEAEASLIVLGLRRRTPVGKLLLGSIAQRIMLDADCPVLTVKTPVD